MASENIEFAHLNEELRSYDVHRIHMPAASEFPEQTHNRSIAAHNEYVYPIGTQRSLTGK